MVEHTQHYSELAQTQEQSGSSAVVTKLGAQALSASGLFEYDAVSPAHPESGNTPEVQGETNLPPASQAPAVEQGPKPAEPSKPGFLVTLAALLLPKVVFDPSLRDKSPAELIRMRGFARVAPRFADLFKDRDRNNVFRTTRYDHEERQPITEHDGLVELKDFLTRGTKSESDMTRRHARSMLENLTFIGEKEYAEGAAGLAEYWKQYLDSDPEAQLCVLTRISAEYSGIKSDRHLLERILRNFSDDEMQKYAGRLVLDVHHLASAPEKVKVVLLDDWVISGSQMRSAISSVLGYFDSKYPGKVEINLLTSTQERISEGLRSYGRDIPVKAYFLAHQAKQFAEYGAYISGTHSSVDYDFRDDLDQLSYPDDMPDSPRLARVKREYGPSLPRTEHLKQLNLNAA